MATVYDDLEQEYYCFDAERFSNKNNSTEIKKEKKHKSSDQELKAHALNLPMSLWSSCNPVTCPYNGGCVNRARAGGEITAMRDGFWGCYSDDAPATKTRKQLIIETLRNFRRPEAKEGFVFVTGNKEKNNSLVCEAGYLILMGISNHPNASMAPTQWRSAKKYVVQGVNYQEIENMEDDKIPAANKTNNAKAFILYFTKTFGDTIPSAEGVLILCCVYVCCGVFCCVLCGLLNVCVCDDVCVSCRYYVTCDTRVCVNVVCVCVCVCVCVLCVVVCCGLFSC